MRTGFIGASLSSVIVLAVLFCTLPAFAQVKHFDIPSQDAGKSIPEFARQAGVQVIAPGEQLRGVITPRIRGAYDVTSALNLMLKGTGLIVGRSPGGIVTISLPKARDQEEREGMTKEQSTVVTASVAALIFGALAVNPVYAQTSDTGPIETVVVTGQRAAISAATEIKEKADVIVDSVSAEDIGKLPDNSVTEVLQRIVGVDMTRITTNSGSEDYVGEGTGITIRGLDSVVSQLNGRDSFSSSNGRSLAWEDIPPELMKGVDVYKSLSASLPEGGFGGIVNLRTRQPFDFDGLEVDATLNGNYADYEAKAGLGGSALISDRWQTGLGDMGLLVNVAYSDLKTKADGVQVTPFVPTVWSANYPTPDGLPWVSTYNLSSDSPSPTACSGAPTFTCQEVYVPQGVNFTQRNDDRVRTGLYAAYQWNPSNDLQLFATVFRSRYTDNALTYSVGTNSSQVALDPSSTNSFDKYGNLLSSNGITTFAYQDPSAAGYFGLSAGWSYQKIPYAFDTNLNHQVNQTTDFSAGGDWTVSESLHVKFALQHVESMARDISKDAALYAFVPGYGLTISPYNDPATPVFTFPNLDLTNRYRFGWQDTMDHISSNGGQENALYADGIYDLSDNGFFRSVRFGVKLTDRRENDWTSPYNWRPLTPSYQSAWVQVDGAGNPQYDSSGNVLQCFAASPTCSSVSAASVNALKSAGSAPAKYSTLVNTGTWFNGKAGLPARVWFPSETLLQQSFTTLHSYTDGLGAPGDQQTAITFTPDDLSRISERQAVFYGQLNFADMIGDIPYSGNIGVRVVSYKDTASGAFVNYYNSSEFTLQSANGYPSCAATSPGVYPPNCITQGPTSVANVIDFTAPKTYVPVSGGHSQTDVLPSLNIQFQPLPVSAPKLKVRLAASQGSARPTFQQMNPSGSISGSYVGTYESYFNGSRGNPDLKPEKAEQLDASIEYYFDDGGVFQVAPFYKQIHNYIANEQVQVPATIPAVIAGGTTDNGTMGCTNLTIGASCQQAVSVAMVEPMNETRTAFVRGIEVGLKKYATFLPGLWSGFGVDMNYTYINSQQPGVLAYDMKGNQINNLPAFGLSQNTVNAALLYDKHPVSFRIAYNWRDSYLVSTAAYQTAAQYNYALNESSAGSSGIPQGQVVHYSLPVFAYPIGTLDANFTYSLTDNIDWTVEASNLTKAVARLFMGVGAHRENRSWYTADTRYTMQLRVKF